MAPATTGISTRALCGSGSCVKERGSAAGAPRRARPELLALIGLHGSLSDDEVSVPVVHVPPAVVA